jgi:hypothetical protein
MRYLRLLLLRLLAGTTQGGRGEAVHGMRSSVAKQWGSLTFERQGVGGGGERRREGAHPLTVRRGNFT